MFRVNIDLNCHFVSLLYHPFRLKLVLALFGHNFQLLKLLCLANDH